MKLHGVVKMVAQSGWGFIARDDGQGDVFVHATALERAGIGWPVQIGTAVAFNIGTSERTGKTQAIDIELVAGAMSERLRPIRYESGDEAA